MARAPLKRRSLNPCHRDKNLQAPEKSHLIASYVEPLQVFMQRHDMIDHGFDQHPRLLLVRVESVGKHPHLAQMGELLVLQHELRQKTKVKAASAGSGVPTTLSRAPSRTLEAPLGARPAHLHVPEALHKRHHLQPLLLGEAQQLLELLAAAGQGTGDMVRTEPSWSRSVPQPPSATCRRVVPAAAPAAPCRERCPRTPAAAPWHPGCGAAAAPAEVGGLGLYGQGLGF